jgi:Flp pilus assembly protein TadD
LRQGDLAGAEEAFRAVAERDPENIEIRDRLSRVLVRLQRPEEARKAAEEAASLDPRNPRAQAQLQRLDAFLARRGGGPGPNRSAAGR